MLKYRITNEGVKDLEDIWGYTCRMWSEDQADRYYNAIISGFKIICSNPTLFGKDYGMIIHGLRGFKINKHIIFYLIESNYVYVIRILHECMDISRQLVT